MSQKPLFVSVEEALAAIQHDRLATVYYRSSSVVVMSSHGTGDFSLEEWRKAGGFANSISKDRST